MKVREFDKLTKAIFSPFLEGEGFKFEAGTYWRETPAGVRQVICFDIDTRAGEKFRVMAGYNSQLLTGDLNVVEAGVLGMKYIGVSGLVDMASSYPCPNAILASQSLERLKDGLRSAVVCLSKQVGSLSDFAEVVEDRYPFFKGKLFFMAGQSDKAIPYLENHRARLEKLGKDHEIESAIIETEELLRQCQC